MERSSAATSRPPVRGWITDEMIAETQQVWGAYLGRPVPEDEAIEMLVNVHRLAEVLAKAVRKQKKGGARERRNLGARVEP